MKTLLITIKKYISNYRIFTAYYQYTVDIPYIYRLFQTQPKFKQICDKYCKSTNIVTAFSPLRIGSFFSCKDSVPKFLQSYVVYQFTCAGCNACYTGKTKRHL